MRSRWRWLRVRRVERGGGEEGEAEGEGEAGEEGEAEGAGESRGEGGRGLVTRYLAISVAANWRPVCTVEGRAARAVGR